MNRTTMVFLLALSAIAIISFAPSNCLQQHWGTKKLYQPADTNCTVAPAGYSAVFINHVGRHGARHLTSLGDLLLVQYMLDDAAQIKALTDDGIKLKDMVRILVRVEKKENCGLLTEAGKQEQKGIGCRMKAHYPALFSDTNTELIVVTTKEKRTVQSAQAFMEGLGRDMQPSSHTHILGNDSLHLRFFEVSPGYRKYKKKGNWIAEMEKLEHTPRAVKEQNDILSKFFTAGYTDRLLHKTGGLQSSKDTLADFFDALFNLATLSNAMQTEIAVAGYTSGQVDVRSLFTCNEFSWLEYVNSAQDFLQKGPGMNANGIQVRNAVPLLVNFINTTDAAIAGNKPEVFARFAHAETLSPFATLLEVKGAATPVSNILDYNKVWDVSNIIGYGANVQWVVYKADGTDKEPLVKILYNEKPVEIPVVTRQFPYYKWSDVRNFYLDKLAKLNVGLDDDMLTYLINLK